MIARILHRGGNGVELALMALSIGPMLVSAYVSYVTGDSHWFQRSSALMVLFSVAVEYRRRQLARSNPDAQRRRPIWRSIPYICYLSIFMGTLVWAYGDLMFAAMMQRGS